MKLLNIIKEIDLEIIAGLDSENQDNEVKGVYICDLLSLVISKAQPQDIWITIQTHVNIIAVSTLVDMTAIIVAENMEIDEETIAKANEVKIPIFRSKLSAYELASRLSRLGI